MSPSLEHHPARLLVADDNKVNRLLLTRNLAIQGHRVVCAENGRVALELLRRDPFDLMLLDMEMPELDGFAVLEQLRGDRQLRDLPVIVTSSLEGLAHVVRCIELGAEGYLPKPVNPILLKARIGSSLEKKRLRDQQKELIELYNAERAAEGKGPIAIGIGIASGDMIAGYTGTQQGATYTCIGSTVNLAARLEAQTKQTPLMNGPTAQALVPEFQTEALGAIAFKGLAEPVATFALVL